MQRANAMTGTEHISLWAVLKNSLYVCSLFVVGLPKDGYSILVSFIILDLLLRIARAQLVRGAQKVTAEWMMANTFAKFGTLSVPLVIAFTGKGVGIDITVLAVWALNVLIIAHAYSILSSIVSIARSQDVGEFDAVNWALGRIQRAIQNYLERAGGRDDT